METEANFPFSVKELLFKKMKNISTSRKIRLS